MKYIIGLDNGGTAIKAAVFDENGKQLAVCVQKVPLLTPEAGFTERNLQELWEANAAAIRGAIKQSGIDPCDVVSLGISGHGKGLYLLDKEGNPLYNGIVSTDGRAARFADEFMKDERIRRYVRRNNHQDIIACQPVCLLRWLKENRADIYGKIGAVLSVKDYIRYRLTGNVFVERTDISGSNLLNLTTGEYDRELLALFGIAEVYDALPPVKNSFDVCGYVTQEAAHLTSLSPDTVVAGGMFDIDACALASGTVADGDVCVIAGTWSINEYISRSPAESVAMNSYYCVDGYYLIEECSPTSAGNLDWFLTRFVGNTDSDFYDRLNEEIGKVDPAENKIMFLPFLFACNENANLRAAFLNVSADSTKAQMAAAIYEGVAFSHKTHIERLKKAKGNIPYVRLAGGVTASPIWCGMFADILGATVTTVSVKEQGCLGAAMAAGIAAGVYEDYFHAAKKTVCAGKTYMPDAERVKLYEQKYYRYKCAVECLKNLSD